MPILSSDVGSLPFVGDLAKFLDGAREYGVEKSDPATYFEEDVVRSFIAKKKAGIDVPSYPQFRDMNEMFVGMVQGLEKAEGGYVMSETLRLSRSKIPEVEAIRKNSFSIAKEVGGSFEMRVCITGPYTLSSLFAYRDIDTISMLGDIESRIIRGNVFNNRNARTSLVILDEPIFGTIDDAMIDAGSEGREVLLKTWGSIFHVVKSLGVRTGMHLHSTTDDLFWMVDGLDVIEAAIDDPIYSSEGTKALLEQEDKFLKASICSTDFNVLIEERVGSDLDKLADAWESIKRGEEDPVVFLDDLEVMKKRLIDVTDRVSLGRVIYAGPECGLRGFPTYDCAIECLRRASKATGLVNRELKLV